MSRASDTYDDRQRAALAYAEAIAWRLDPTDELEAAKAHPDYWAASRA